MSDILSSPYFQDETAAYAKLESIVWPNGPVCPHCGGFERINRLKGTATRPGLLKCYQCRKQFRVTVGTVFEASHVPLRLWFQAAYLLCSSKKGVSSNQLHRTLGVTLKTAWFMSHRLRAAMAEGSVLGQLGGEGKTVEADETYYGPKDEKALKTTSGRPFTKGGKGRGVANKRAIVSLVERGANVRSFHMKEHPTVKTVAEVLAKNVAPATVLHTDESRLYPPSAPMFAGHETVKHSAEEYVRGQVHTNTIEGFFSIFKRGMVGVYQHCGERHLHRYLAEFDFRYNKRIARGVDDKARTDAALSGIVGKRLTYRDS